MASAARGHHPDSDTRHCIVTGGWGRTNRRSVSRGRSPGTSQARGILGFERGGGRDQSQAQHRTGSPRRPVRRCDGRGRLAHARAKRRRVRGGCQRRIQRLGASARRRQATRFQLERMRCAWRVRPLQRDRPRRGNRGGPGATNILGGRSPGHKHCISLSARVCGQDRSCKSHGCDADSRCLRSATSWVSEHGESSSRLVQCGVCHRSHCSPGTQQCACALGATAEASVECFVTTGCCG